MFGILLAGLSSGLSELSDLIGKKEMRARVASHYTIGFLSIFFGTVFLIASGILRDTFVFSFASLPTLVPRIILEIVQAQITIMALKRADRSDFGFVRTLTIPLLLMVDLTLGYAITTGQMFGIAVIVTTVFILFSFEKYRTKGFWLLLGSAVNAVLTISLYKYDITHFNSVESEQTIVSLIIMLYFFVFAVSRAKENPFSYLLNPLFAIQSISSGLAVVIGAFAILFAPASVITAAFRALAVLFSIISGKYYFHEKKFVLKCILFVLIAVGIVLLAR